MWPVAGFAPRKRSNVRSSVPGAHRGGLTMRARANITLTSDEQKTVALWSRWAFAICAIAITAVLALSIFAPSNGRSLTAQAQEPSLRPMCALWDRQASEAIALRVQDSKNDVELRRLGDSIFRMRRARRNCELGWVRIACQDYHAILRNVSGTSIAWPRSASVCPPAMSDGSAANTQQTVN
jgi:hypothetical protein